MDTAGGILKKIVEAKRKRLAESNIKLEDVRDRALRASDSCPALDFRAAISSSPCLSVIAEIKKASPSAGIIRQDFEPAKIAKAYSEASADAISVLTEEDFFLGSAEYLKLAKAAVPGIPILRKDFIYSEFQVFESRIIGADSFLLIVSMIDEKTLKKLIETGRMLGMEPLVETCDASQIKTAADAGASIIGVNNRDLRTFRVDIHRSIELVGEIPKGVVKVSESGISCADDCAKLAEAGFDAILAGASLMKEKEANLAETIRKLKIQKKHRSSN